MQMHWVFNSVDVALTRDKIAQRADCWLVRQRSRWNLAEVKAPVSREDCWHALVAAPLTSQQKSGPDSLVMQFVIKKPWPLRVELCEGQGDLATFARDTLAANGLTRFSKRIPSYIAANLPQLSGAAWDLCAAELEHLRVNQNLESERRAARFFQRFKGLGPKQSRNALQMLGLTRYVVPLDTRIIQWLNTIGFPIQIEDSEVLQYEEFYQVVEDGLQALSAACGVAPCILDAAVFGSVDEVPWTEETAVW